MEARHPNDPQERGEQMRQAALRLSFAERRALLEHINLQLAELDSRSGDVPSCGNATASGRSEIPNP